MAGLSASVVLFDLGNVLMRWDPMRLYARIFPDQGAAQKFLSDINWPVWHLEHDRGVPFARNAPPLIERLPHYKEPIEAWFGRWTEMFDGPVAGVPEIMRELAQKQVPLYALTNFPAEKTRESFALYPEMTMFRDVIVSGELGLVKPDPAIYEVTLRRIGTDNPADVFFIDDNRANIDAARAFGFQAHLFEGAEGARKALVEAGLLP